MKRKTVDLMMLICCLAVSCLSLAPCDNELDVQREYLPMVESTPVVGKVANGEMVKIRLEIKAEENFFGTVYTLRYSQPDGKGSLEMEDGMVLKPSDRHLLNELRFRLYCTLRSTDVSQVIDLYSEDNWGNLQRLNYDLNADDTPPAEKDDTHRKEVRP